jgi:muconolactone delta-isomerase
MMKILAIEKEVPGIRDEQIEPHLKSEAGKAWELYQNGIIRELYFRADWDGAVLVLECSNAEEAKEALGSLPLVKNGLIAFDVIPLKSYPGFERLFAEKNS